MLFSSGHGGRWRDGDDDKSAGYDETLIPVDVRTAGHIRDDELYKNLLCAMPAGVHTTIVMDSRHSVMHLPYKMDAPGQEEGTMQMSEIGGYAFHGLIGLAAIGTVAVAVGGGVLASNAVGSGGGGGGNWGCCNDIFGSIFGDN
jgi:metacaspase-1